MKRSEMIQLLDSEFIWPEGMASDVLSVLEQAGMLPPATMKERMVNVVREVNEASKMISVGTKYEIGEVNEWEEENPEPGKESNGQ